MLEETLAAIQPYSRRRAAVKALALLLARTIPDVAERSTLPVHATGSAFVIDPEDERVLLVRHPKFGRWLQPGGHCDGDPDIHRVALREAVEETGLGSLVLDPVAFDVDLHPGEPNEHPHMHMDVRFAGVVPAGISKLPLASPESLELRWFALAELRDEQIAEAAEGALAHLRYGRESPGD